MSIQQVFAVPEKVSEPGIYLKCKPFSKRTPKTI